MAKKPEVVISGIAGLFPECDDFEELSTKLLSGVDLVTNDNRRWTPGDMGVPSFLGKVRNPEDFDITLFGIPRKLVNITDPLTRLSVMQGYRAVCDAGVNPNEISGANIPVLMSSFISETEAEYLTVNADLGTYGVLANARAMQANRLSFFLNLKGPSNVFDGTWCGGVQALQCAYDLIASGAANAALVGSAALMTYPHLSVHYQALGALSQDGATRSFSSDAAGYVRAEATVVMFLQRAQDARRSYGTILGANIMYRGLKPQKYLDVCPESFERFLRELYAEAGVDPKDVAYYEGSGSASRVADAKELNTVARIFLKGRSNPLLVGSVKSNLGHTEGASVFVSLAKALIALDRGTIPPNLHYTAPNPDIPALVSGKMKVVTTPTELEGDIVAVNEVGLAGGLSHIIVKRNPKVKPPLPELGQLPANGIPRLVLLSDRNKTNIHNIMKRLTEMPIDEEFCTIINKLQKEGVKGQLLRGYTVLNGTENPYNAVKPCTATKKSERKPVWFVFSGMGSQWPTMGKSLMRLPIFARSVEECHRVLLPKGIDLIEILTSEDSTVFDSILNCFVGIAAVQIGLVDVLRAVGIEADGMVGHSVGELGCGYADGCLTSEQMILSAYMRGKASLDATLIKGYMAAVGLGYNDLKDKVPEAIDIACHNSSTSSTLSGPIEDMVPYIAKLKNQSTFAKLVTIGNDIAYHSRYIQPAGPLLLNYLKPIIPQPKLRSSKWLSSSCPESEWGTELAKYSSAEYYTNNLLSAVLFEEVASQIPSDAIVIEIAPHGLLQAILRRSHPNNTHIPLTSKYDGDNIMHLLGALGKLYIDGVFIDVERLYPSVQFPVSRGTPALSTFVGWENTEKFQAVVTRMNERESILKDVSINMREDKYASLVFHKIRNKVILPHSYYLNKMAKYFMKIKGKRHSVIDFESVKFQNEAEVPLSGSCDLNLQLHEGTGTFCVTNCNGAHIYSSGKMAIADCTKPRFEGASKELADDAGEYRGEEIVAFMNTYGLCLENKFAVIKQVDLDKTGLKAIVNWNGSMLEFLNGLLTLIGFFNTKRTNTLHIVREIVKLTIDYTELQGLKNADMEVSYDHISRFMCCKGISMLVPETGGLEVDTMMGDSSFDVHRFVPYDSGEIGSEQYAITICYRLIMENSLIPTDSSTKIRVMSVGENLFRDALTSLAKIYSQIQLNTMVSEQALLEQDTASLRGEILWIVSAKLLSREILETIKSYASRVFILGPKTEASNEKDTISEMFTFSSSFENFVLSSIASDNLVRTGEKVHVSNNYIPLLESKLMQANEKNINNKAKTEVVYLIGQFDSQSTILRILDDTKQLPHHHLLRYLFGNGKVEELEEALDRKLLKKDLKTHVIWGTTVGSMIPFSIKSTGFTLKSNIDEPMLHLSNIVSPNDTAAVGLNLMDVTGSLDKDDIGVLDYADSKEMSLGQYDPLTQTFVRDDILKWNKPQGWTVSEAATVPLLYSLAMHIFETDTSAEDIRKSIMITRGLLPLSQALIAIALSRCTDVFVTVYGDQEKRQLMKLFPNLLSENIFDCSSATFYIGVLQKTQGKGLYKVVNTFKEDYMIQSCVQCIGPHGICINVSMSPMVNKQKMGMLPFGRQVLVVGISAESMMKLPEGRKMKIRDALEKAIQDGVVHPFSRIPSIPAEAINIDKIEDLKLTKAKLILYWDGKANDKRRSLTNYSTNEKLVIISDLSEESVSWLELTGWLLSRGARNVSVVLNNADITGARALRLQSLKEKYGQSFNLTLTSLGNLSSTENIERFLKEVDNDKGLSSIFILSSSSQDIACIVDQVLEERGSRCGMICIGRGAERVCEKRSNQGLSSLCVRVGKEEANFNTAIDFIDDLINQSHVNPIVSLKETSSSKVTASQEIDRLCIPQSFGELHQLLLLSTPKPSFAEIQTNSPRKRFVRDLDPVFIFPGLRPQKIRAIARKLIYPALEVRLPKGGSLSQMATELASQLSQTPRSMFTLVAEGWGGILALDVAAKLESLGKIVRVVLVDAGPSTTKQWAAELLADPSSLISRYISVPYEVKRKLKCTDVWDEIVGAIVAGSTIRPDEKELTIDSLNLLNNRLQSALSSDPPKYKMRRPCYLFNYESGAKMDQCGLEEYLRTEAIVRAISSDTEEGVDRIADEIAPLALYETKDRANPPSEDFFRVNFIKGRTKVGA